jgi:ribosomal protein L29
MSKIELDLIDLIENFEDGDVVTLASIREEIIALTNNLSHDKKIFELIDDLPHFIEHLASASKNQKQIMDKLLDIIKIITEYIDSEDKEKNKLLKNLKKPYQNSKMNLTTKTLQKSRKIKKKPKQPPLKLMRKSLREAIPWRISLTLWKIQNSLCNFTMKQLSIWTLLNLFYLNLNMTAQTVSF